MKLMLALFATGAIMELIVCVILPASHAVRVVWVGLCLVVIGVSSAALSTYDFSGFSALLLSVSVYRVVNLLRVVEGRMHSEYLRRAVLRTSLYFLSVQIGLLLLWLGWAHKPIAIRGWWEVVALLQLLAALAILLSTARHASRARTALMPEAFSDIELPTVSVLIPARNETVDLQACIESLLISDYPKLEIIWLYTWYEAYPVMRVAADDFRCFYRL